MPTTSDFHDMLRGAALCVTRPRLAVLSAVHDHPHADTDSIIGIVRAALGGVSHQAVYDVLRALGDNHRNEHDPLILEGFPCLTVLTPSLER